MTIFAALAVMAILVLVVEAVALAFRATLPKEGRPEATWTPLAPGVESAPVPAPRAA